jgi:hypothetical protein
MFVVCLYVTTRGLLSDTLHEDLHAFLRTKWLAGESRGSNPHSGNTSMRNFQPGITRTRNFQSGSTRMRNFESGSTRMRNFQSGSTRMRNFSQPHNHVVKSMRWCSHPARQASAFPPTERSLVPDDTDVTDAFRKGPKPNCGECPKIITLCLHFQHSYS